MQEKISWTELRRMIAARAGVSEKNAGAFLNSFHAQLVEALRTERQVKINGLGTFKLQAVAPRKSVNVTTGEEITIEGYNKIVFSPEAGVKELIESQDITMENKKAKGTNSKAKKAKEEVNDPLKKLGAQAAEIVDILGELGQNPQEEKKAEPAKKKVVRKKKEEPKVEEPKVEEPKAEEPVAEQVAAPEAVVEPEPLPFVAPEVKAPEPAVVVVEPEPEPEKPKKKHHFWRDTLICVIILLILLAVAWYFFRNEISEWIKNFIEQNKTEQVETTKTEETTADEQTASFTDEQGAAIEDAIVEEPVTEEPIAISEEETKYPNLIKTEELTEGSRLAWIAKKYYGSQVYWPYLYDANKDHLDDPSKVTIGTPIRVPRLSKAQKDTTSVEFMELKRQAESAIR